MGLFTKMQQTRANIVYEQTKPHLKEKDGNVHVVMFNSFSKYINQIISCEDKYTEQLDLIVTAMQNDGYEIVDVKFNSIMNQGLFGEMEGYNTLIMYR